MRKFWLTWILIGIWPPIGLAEIQYNANFTTSVPSEITPEQAAVRNTHYTKAIGSMVTASDYLESPTDVYNIALSYMTQKEFPIKTLPESLSLYHLFVVAAYQAEIILCPLTNNLSFSQALRPAFQYYFRKATTGDVDAQFRLGVGYYYGLGIETDLNKALYWLSQAAKQNYTAAEVFLGVLNDQALLPNHTEQAALQWFFRAAKQNDPIGKTMLGIYYLYGRGNLVADPNIANYWLQQSVKLNYGLAQVYLAELYYSGKGVEQNYPHALQLFKKGVNNPSTPIKAQIFAADRLATMYASGLGTDVDAREASRWLNQVNALKLVLQCKT